MEAWSVHHLYQSAQAILGNEKARSLQLYAQNLIHSNLPVIFTLKHLSIITKVDYSILRTTVQRKRETVNYKMFSIRKRSGGWRWIHAVSRRLFQVQQFLNSELLQHIAPHPASFAFHSQGGIRKCAAMHCGAVWLFQYDLQDFFYDINEMDVYRVFSSLGYRSLLAFELARICTTTRLPDHLSQLLVHNSNLDYLVENARRFPYFTDLRKVGVLPQGAPTSPALSNLVARELDVKLTEFANQQGFVYTRYADDITFSASYLPRGESVAAINRAVVGIIRKCGFKENSEKKRVARPGSKKIVLGLLVDTDKPRLSKETYKRIERLLYAAGKFGLTEVAVHEGFDSAFGFYNHLSGLVAFVKDVDKDRHEKFKIMLHEIDKLWV
jgi:RNA-directed DNA polymerase